MYVAGTRQTENSATCKEKIDPSFDRLLPSIAGDIICLKVVASKDKLQFQHVPSKFQAYYGTCIVQCNAIHDDRVQAQPPNMDRGLKFTIIEIAAKQYTDPSFSSYLLL